MANRRLVSYRNIEDHYATPATGGVGSAGWFRQAAHNFSMMMNAARITGADYSGVIGFTPQWEGVTVADTTSFVPTFGGYVRVGTVVWLWAGCDITAIGDTGLKLTNLPVAPADTILPMHAGYGMTWDGITSYLPMAGEVDGSDLVFYYAWSVTDGRVIDGDILTVAGTGSVQVYATYRCAAAPVGYLTSQNYLIESQE
jgi:hypothetical protein